MKLKYLYISLLIVLTSITSCVDFEVENLNNPDTETVLQSEEGIEALASGLFNQFYNIEQHNLNSPGPSMWVMADWGTVTWANYGCVDMSMEPRVFLNNVPSYGYHRNIRNFWRTMYGMINSANYVVKAVDQGMQLGENGEDTMMIDGFAHFMQGIGNGYIGLIYDKAYWVDENADFESGLIIYSEWEITYQEAINNAIEQLEEAIIIFENAEAFTLPDTWMNGNSFTNEDMIKLAHSFIARLMVYAPRNTNQSEMIDWQKVLYHAQAGITEDFTIEGDGDGSNRKWMSWYKYYLARPTWGKVDMRIVNMLDDNLPANWPIPEANEPPTETADLPNGGVIVSGDARAQSDFQFDPSNNRPERGYYRWSSYRYSRLDEYIDNNFFSPVILMRKAENDLFIAEAYARLEQYGDAAAIINSGTRITRGLLPAVSNDAEEINEAIFYERNIELPLTGMGIEYFDMRRNGLLQDGSLLHFPVPAQQLEIMGMDFYSFGGVSPQYGTPNEDVSVNGWFTP